MGRRGRLAVASAVFLALVLAAGVAGAFTDFGSFVQAQLRHRSGSLFGVSGPLASSSSASLSAAEASAHPERLATVANSLKVRVISHGVAAPNRPARQHKIDPAEDSDPLDGAGGRAPRRLLVVAGEVLEPQRRQIPGANHLPPVASRSPNPAPQLPRCPDLFIMCSSSDCSSATCRP
jgi:hypothetical protein